ncbi:MAG: PTS sugar transporter subunit IIA [Spirochaetes bacterium]|nr:PTS sugar transporter subunit IIA [Spirochaetota bacterium]
MILSKSLKKNNIIIKAQSANRWDLIEEMLDLAIKNNDVRNEDREILKNALFEREKSMSTGIGRGVAIPHCTTEAVEDIVIVLAFCGDGIDFESIDSLPVKIAIFILVPKNKLKQHIKTLANIARLMNKDELREKLFTVKKPEMILKIIKNFEKDSE